MAIKINLKTKAGNAVDDSEDSVLRVRASEYINTRVESYGRGYQDGLLTSGLVLAAVAAGVGLTDYIMKKANKK